MLLVRRRHDEQHGHTARRQGCARGGGDARGRARHVRELDDQIDVVVLADLLPQKRVDAPAAVEPGDYAGVLERLDGLQLHPELPLVVRDAASVEPLAPDDRVERVALPELERIRRLHVVVPVDENGRRFGRPGDLPDDEPSVLADVRVTAEPPHRVGDPRGRALHVAGVLRIGAHARDREERGELLEPAGGKRRRHRGSRVASARSRTPDGRSTPKRSCRRRSSR